MKILVACEYSGIVRNAFSIQGHNAWSCDIIPSSSPGQHIIGDAIEVAYFGRWDMIIAHPPCTYLAKVQQWMVNRSLSRRLSQVAAEKFFMLLYNAPCPLVAVENPRGRMTRAFRSPDQSIHPYMFGDPYRKEISLWLKGLRPLVATEYSPGRKSVDNHCNSRMTQSQKSHIRSRFFFGVAKAMAIQWSDMRIGS